MGRDRDTFIQSKKTVSLVDMATMTMHIKRLKNGSFDDKLQHLIKTVLEERLSAVHQTKVVYNKKLVRKKKPLIDKYGCEVNKKTKLVEEEEIEKTRVPLDETERRAVFIRYRAACECMRDEFEEAKKEVSMARSKPHRDIINNILIYIVDNPEDFICNMDLAKIISQSKVIRNDMEYAVKSEIHNRGLKSYNDRVNDEKERRFYLFKASPDSKLCKEVQQYRLLKDNPDALHEFEEHLKLNPITVPVVSPPPTE